MRINDSHVYQPGEIVPISGQYRTVTPAGEKIGKAIICEKDGRFPPVGASAYGFLLAEQSNRR